ncbi:MAG TPA: SDR family NAD(P)-dependent oxidoreductase [Acidobacteriaceae bacterium]|nr:SDR family NAD(P)-dependent oxidoreductase [Acidobacteriaceae bacterium]
MHQNVSDFRQQRFATGLDGTEPCLTDHVIAGRKTLPGAAYLEMARAAGELSAREPIRELRNVAWIRPLEIGVEPLHIEIRLRAGDPIAWEVCSDDTVYCRGEMTASAIAPQPRHLDLDAIRRRCANTQSGSTCYEQFEQRQVSYGPMFRGLQEIHYGKSDVLAEVHLRDLDATMHLHPGLVDSALQAALGFSIDVAGGTYLPVSVSVVRLHDVLPERLFAHLGLQASGDAPVCDVTLCDETGRILVELDGVTFKAIGRSTSEVGTMFLDEVWAAEEVMIRASDPAPVRRLVIQYSPNLDHKTAVPDALLIDSRSSDLGDNIRAEFQQVFDRVQRELIDDPKSPLHVFALFPDGEEAFRCAPLAGLLKSAHLEHPHLHAKVVYMAAGADPLAILERESASVFGVQEIRYRPERQVKRLRETVFASKGDTQLPSSGVYWITGGIGGLGRLIAEHLCREGATIILSGRRSCPTEAQTWIESLNTRGGTIVYRQTDIADRTEVQSTFEWIRSRYGLLTGVLHCAGVVHDAMIVKKDRSEIDEVLGAKISGTLNLDAVTASEPLDFFVLFSSGSGTLGNAGQSDYAGANSFLDAFAAHRASLLSAGLRHGRTCSIAWPLWAAGGMRIDEATLRMMRAHSGLMPLSTRDGLDAFDHILFGQSAAAPPFVMVAHGVLAKLRKTLLAPPLTFTQTASTAVEKSRIVNALVDEVSYLLKIPTADIDPEADLSELGFDSITFTELINNLNDHYNLDLSKTVLFEHSTLDSFVAHLAKNYASHFAGSDLAATPHTPSDTSAPEAPTELKPVLTPEPIPASANAFNPIAIVGVSAIFPGAPDLDAFWRNLEAGVDSVTEIPRDRWDWRAFSAKTTVTRAGFISGVDQFDPVFFGISPREAKLMDPQERLFLQAAWKAMEDAGHSKAELSGSNTGVFVGVGVSDYAGLLKAKGVVEGFGAEPHFWVANRVSYTLNLRGPSASIDTACSSSLVAIHRAVRAIKTGECEQAIAGGVNTLVSPNLFISIEQSGVLARDGKCKTFDREADGYVRGEGVGALFLKPLSAALRDRNPIYGLIRGTAENHGGHTTGVTVPNPNAQADLLVAAYRQAGFDLSMIDYFEAHGTGTPLGDPIEINGILKAARALSQDIALRRRSNPSCAVGSVKANIGHLEAGAGVASVVKMLLAMRHRTVPGNIHLRSLNDQINVDGSGLYFPRANQPWSERFDDLGEPMPRRAGVSSFGVGGSNAHVVLEEWPESQHVTPSSIRDTGPFLIVLSARSRDRLEAMARNLLTWPIADLRDTAYTLQVGRDAMSDRAAFLVNDVSELKSKLQRFVDGSDCAAKDSLVSQEEVSRVIEERDWPILGDLWVHGTDIPWAALYFEPLPNRVPLPTYPFKPRRCWVDTDTAPHANAESAIAPAPLSAPPLPALPSNSVKTEIIEGHIAVITMQDREQRNMLSDEVVGGLIHAFSEIGRNQEILAIIVTGSDGVFGMGGTEEWLNRLADGKSTCIDVPFLYEGLLKAEVPVIAAMQGHAAGGSLVFGLYADMIVMAQEGVYCANFMKYGFTPGMGATYLLEKKLGSSLAAEMMYTAKWFRGEELEKRGAPFVFRPAAEVLDQAIEMARMLAEKPRESLTVLKQRLSSSILEELPRVLAEEVRMHDRTLQNPIVKERIRQQFYRREIAPPTLLESSAPAAATAKPASRSRIKLTAIGVTEASSSAHEQDPAQIQVPILAPIPPPAVVPATFHSVREEITNIVMRVLDMLSDDLDDRLNFRELGVDSIGAIEIVRDINKRFDLNLDAVILYDHPTIDAVTEFVASRARIQPTTIQPAAVQTAADTPPVAPSSAPAPASAPQVISDAKAIGMDIAVIGISGRFPGAPDIDTFWANIAAGVCSVAEVPPSRWPLNEFYDPDPNAPDKSYCKWGGLLDGVDRFDPLFFNLSPVEAEQIEPQQRLFLETAWHAVEDAGYAPQSLKDFTCGVFVGVGAGDYGLALQKAGVAATPQSFIGNHVSILPARIAYYLNLTGPTMAIDTACSSSLVAIHQACQSLLHGDCNMALAGGVSIMATSAMYVPTSKAGMLSPTGLCKSFDNSADGFVPAEGVGVLVLKSLEHALRDGDSIYAVIKASGVNQDGATNGITAPSAASQETLLTGIYRRWGIDPERIGYMEAHGTGTQLGDPIEVLALTETFRKFTPRKQYCAIGSVKSNVGHPLAAAGVAGVVKAIMALRAQQLPPTLHCKDENHHIHFAAGPFYVNRTLRPWAANPSHPRQAAVSSFGLSGTNAHIVLEEHCAERFIPADSPALVVLSAKTQDRLQEVAWRLSAALRSGAWSLDEVAYTLQTGREAMPHRIACVAGSLDELARNLEQLDSATWVTGTVRRARDVFQIDAAVTDFREIAEQWVRGGSLDWNRLYRGRRPRRAHLPSYPFARERSWVTPASEPAPDPKRKFDPEPATLCAIRQWVAEPLLPASSSHSVPQADRLILTDPAFASDLVRIRHAFPDAELISLEGAGMSLDDRVEKRFLQLFQLLQRRISGRPTQPQEVLVLTPLEDGDAAPIAALLKTARLENPLFRGKVIQADSDGTAILQAEVTVPGAFEQVRYIAGSRQIERLSEVSLKEESTPIRENGVYWLTGGLGGLGRIFAEHIASVRGAKIIVSGRALWTPERGAWVTDLRSRGVSIEYLPVDVGDHDAVETAFQCVKSQHGSLTGIIHSAGVIHDAYLLKKTPEQAAAVLRPKVHGAVNLDEVTHEEPLDFVAFFSSGSGAFGNPGQADYAAANAFLDEFAVRRNALVESGRRSGVTVSIGWPLWAGGGMGVDHATEAAMKHYSGAVPLPAAAGIRIFEQALQSPYAYVLVAAGELAKLRDRLFRRIDMSASASSTLRQQSPADQPLRDRMRSEALEFFKMQLSAILKVPPERIEPDAPFEEYGIDSVMVVRLNSELESIFGPLSKTLFFEYQTLEELVDYFLKAHGNTLQNLLGEAKPQQLSPKSHTNGWDRLAEQFLRDEISNEELSLHFGSRICSKN